jgi:peroxiredoxin
MNRTRLCALLLALYAAPSCASPAAEATAEVTAVVGRFAPAVHLEWLDGSPATGLESLRGRVVLLGFWRTWCGPCRQQVDHLNELHERFEADGLVTIGVSNEPAELLRTAASELDVRYALARTEGAQAEGPYGIRSVPRAFLIDRSGVLVWAGHPATLETERLRSLLLRR